MARQAIATRYFGPSNHRGARIKALSQAGGTVVPWDHSRNCDGNHARAAEALANRFGWTGDWIEGGAPDGKGNVYVWAPDGRGDVAFTIKAEGGKNG